MWASPLFANRVSGRRTPPSTDERTRRARAVPAAARPSEGSRISSAPAKGVAMQRFEERIDVAAPVDRVYAYVSDMTTHEDWSGNGLKVTKETDGPVAVGTVYATTAKQFGTQRERRAITEMSPGRAFAWDSVGALGRAHHAFALEGNGG